MWFIWSLFWVSGLITFYWTFHSLLASLVRECMCCFHWINPRFSVWHNKWVIASSLTLHSCSVRDIRRGSFTEKWNVSQITILILLFYQTLSIPEISNRGRYNISNINKQLTIYQRMLKTWWINLFRIFCNVAKNLVQ